MTTLSPSLAASLPPPKPVKRPECDSNKPKCALLAYNGYFKENRERFLEERPENEDAKIAVATVSQNKKRPPPYRKISFESMTKELGKRWKRVKGADLDHFQIIANEDMERYRKEMAAYL